MEEKERKEQREKVKKKLVKNILYIVSIFSMLIILSHVFVFKAGKISNKYNNTIYSHPIETKKDKTHIEKEIIIELKSNNSFKWDDYGYKEGLYRIGNIVEKDKLSTETLNQIKKEK